MSNGPRVPPPRHVPTLTEVVDEDGTVEAGASADWPQDADLALPVEPVDPEDREPAPTPADDEQQLVRSVLAEVQRQIDPVLEQRLRETLTTVLARWSDALIDDARQQLAGVLHDVVMQAVARELERRRR